MNNLTGLVLVLAMAGADIYSAPLACQLALLSLIGTYIIYNKLGA